MKNCFLRKAAPTLLLIHSHRCGSSWREVSLGTLAVMAKLLWVNKDSENLISSSARWWSAWRPGTTMGWWWRPSSRSLSSTSSPSSTTTPGTLSTLSHVGILWFFSDTVLVNFLLFDCNYKKSEIRTNRNRRSRWHIFAACIPGELTNFLLLGFQIYFTDLFLDKKFAW